MRIAFLGDVHGRPGVLLSALASLGVEVDVSWPTDLVVCQLGDQIDQGPDSAGVLALRGRLLAWNAARWVDLWGNHEAPYVGMAPKFSPSNLSREDARLLRLDTERLFAVGARTRSGRQILATHGGVTFDWWHRYLRSSTEIDEVAALANRLWEIREAACSTPGLMLDPDCRPNMLASPLWAHAGYEVVQSWEEYSPPFDQVTGHSGLAWWDRSDAFGRPLETHESALSVIHDTERRHSTLTFTNGATVTVIDPHVYSQSRPEITPLVVEDVTEVWGTGLLFTAGVDGQTV